MPLQPSPQSVTRLLVEWSHGGAAVLNELAPMVYGELHRIAESFMRHERADHTLQPTALVHEAFLRLIDQRDVNWQNRA
ncbi:MAG: RNA polymerase subunit sigma-70, partial [Pyrinomonadaceae bacterium]|nr:RNA polymerase subunit sigma-70 [Pyrinomonadaceae bacterium]